mgnify:CR=1 FL=1
MARKKNDPIHLHDSFLVEYVNTRGDQFKRSELIDCLCYARGVERELAEKIVNSWIYSNRLKSGDIERIKHGVYARTKELEAFIDLIAAECALAEDE